MLYRMMLLFDLYIFSNYYIIGCIYNNASESEAVDAYDKDKLLLKSQKS